jgi:hypothetical protein
LFILPEALMSDTNQTFSNPPSNPNAMVQKDGYSARFYPGFVRRLAVRSPEGTETELYRQSGTFFLPPGFDKPWATSTLEFVRPDGRRLVLQIEDPDQQIDRIEVHLKGKDGTPAPVMGEPDAMAPADEEPPPPPPGEVLICEDGAVLCPPWCPEGE